MPHAPLASRGRPRLAYLFSRYPVISQTFVDNEILALEAAGWEVIVCSIHPSESPLRHPRLTQLRAPVLYAPPPAVRKGIEQHESSLQRWPDKHLKAYAEKFGENTRPQQTWQNCFSFAEQMRALGVDHVHLHFANRATHAAVMLKRLAGIPFSFTPQAQDFLVDIESPQVLADMCEAATFVVVPCDWAGEQLLRLCPETAPKMRRIYNGIDPSPYLRASPAPPPGALRIVSVARLIEFKGFRHLIAAMAKARVLGTKVHLDLMGDGPLRQSLEAQVAELDLGSQVTFHGSVTIDAMRACYAASDAFALACIQDSAGAMDVFPTVITEAMVSGLPVISCAIAGVPEQVLDGVTGFVTQPGDEDALATALHRLASEPGLAAKMGEAGRARAMEVFAVDKTLPMLEAELVQLPAKAQPAPAATIGTYYDLSAEAHHWLVPTESPVLQEHHAQVWMRGDTLKSKQAAQLAPHFARTFWVPDEAVLEIEWKARPEDHSTLGSMRSSLGKAVTDEVFAKAARTALWIAVQARRLGMPRQWYVPSEQEILVLSLVHELTQVPIVLSQSILRAWPGGEMVEVLPKRPRGLSSRPRRGVARLLPWLRPWQTKRWQAALRDGLNKL